MEENKDCPMRAFMEMLEKLVASPDVDPAVISKLVDMNELAMERRAKVAYSEAMVRAQAAMPLIIEDANNSQTRSTYAKYKTLIKYTRPIYTTEGFSMMFGEGETDKPDNIRVCLTVLHTSGHSEYFFVDIPLDLTGAKGTVNKTKTHAKGSSISYGKTYLLKMVFNLSTGKDDDDGNLAGGSPVGVTEVQVKNIKALQKKAGLSQVMFNKRLKANYGVTDIILLTLADADTLTKNLKLMGRK